MKLLVINNGMLNQIAWEQMMFLGNPQFACELQPIDFQMAAEALSGIGYSVSRPEEIDGVLYAAFAAEAPVVIEAVLDSYEPMMPPRMPDEYRKNMLKALPETPGRMEIEAEDDDGLRDLFIHSVENRRYGAGTGQPAIGTID